MDPEGGPAPSHDVTDPCVPGSCRFVPAEARLRHAGGGAALPTSIIERSRSAQPRSYIPHQRGVRFMHRIAALSLSAIVAVTAAVSAENWPQWRGPNGQGISSETQLPTEWGP